MVGVSLALQMTEPSSVVLLASYHGHGFRVAAETASANYRSSTSWSNNSFATVVETQPSCTVIQARKAIGDRPMCLDRDSLTHSYPRIIGILSYFSECTGVQCRHHVRTTLDMFLHDWRRLGSYSLDFVRSAYDIFRRSRSIRVRQPTNTVIRVLDNILYSTYCCYGITRKPRPFVEI
jgi:hypothetical protein